MITLKRTNRQFIVTLKAAGHSFEAKFDNFSEALQFVQDIRFIK